MDKKVYIIHHSAIVQNGLASILRQYFKCPVRFYSDLSFLQSEENDFTEAIIFIEDVLANTEEYLNFINTSSGLISFSIENGSAEEKPSHSQYTLLLSDSPCEIYDQVKHAFKQETSDEERSEDLTNREIDVLKLVALGNSNKEIADKLFISTHTVMSHRKNLTEKLGIKSISGLTVYAIINNYIDTTNLNIKDLI